MPKEYQEYVCEQMWAGPFAQSINMAVVTTCCQEFRAHAVGQRALQARFLAQQAVNG